MDKVPRDAILARGSHLRFICLWTKERRDLPLAIAIISSTRILDELEWDMIFTKQGGTTFQELWSAFGSLPCLRVLHIENWIRCGNNNLARILNHNPRLEEMVLRNFVGVDSLEDFQPLMYLTTLRLGCMWKSNPGLVHLPRFSPNLMTLALYPDPNCPVLGFFGNVKEFCPKLTIIERAKHDGIDADEMNWSQEMDLALVGSTSYVVYIELPFSELSGENPVLESNLKHFAICNQRRGWIPEACMSMFEFPWTCSKLESFTLSGVAFNRHDDYGDYTCDTYEPFVRDPDDLEDEKGSLVANEETPQPEVDAGSAQIRQKLLAAHGWYSIIPPGSWEYEDASSYYSNVLLKRMLRRVITMPKMREASLNVFRYYRSAELN
ncbi:hypothetical protein BG000_010375 [Podila horticola]|nr:hypothetical protein BG000_010375 [Podila horticola]